MNVLFIRKKSLLILFVFLSILHSQIGIAKNYNVLSFGAVSDTTHNSTIAFQQAIDVCASAGGGQVLIPAGEYLIGSIFLKSNVELHLSHGAQVFGSKKKEDYTPVKPSFVSLRTQEQTIQLIYAEKATNIALTGSGEINGQGMAFKKNNWNDEGIERPHLIRFIECRQVRVEQLSLKNAACWMQHYLACEDVFIQGLKIFNHSNFNNDGIDIDGCKNVIISDVIVDSDDDAIVLKSTSNRACENVVIYNCLISSHCNALKLGTESNAGFKNIKISNCLVKPSRVDTSKFYGLLNGISGISLEVVDGGVLEDVHINDISISGTEVPLFIRLGARNRPFQEGQTITNKGSIRNVYIRDIVANNAGKIGCSITGLSDNRIEHVQIQNVTIQFSGGGSRQEAEKQLPFDDYTKSYPEATMFGVLPSYGLYIRNVQNIQLKNIQLEVATNDARPAIHLENVNDARFSALQLQAAPAAPYIIRAKNIPYLVIQDSQVHDQIPHFLKIEGTENGRIYLLNNNFFNLTKNAVLAKKKNMRIVQRKGNNNFK